MARRNDLPGDTSVASVNSRTWDFPCANAEDAPINRHNAADHERMRIRQHRRSPGDASQCRVRKRRVRCRTRPFAKSKISDLAPLETPQAGHHQPPGDTRARQRQRPRLGYRSDANLEVSQITTLQNVLLPDGVPRGSRIDPEIIAAFAHRGIGVGDDQTRRVVADSPPGMETVYVSRSGMVFAVMGGNGMEIVPPPLRRSIGSL